jgi:hypothetical protein
VVESTTEWFGFRNRPLGQRGGCNIEKRSTRIRQTDNKSMLLQSTPNRGGINARKYSLRSVLRISMPVSVLLYCASFNWSYVKWISPAWGYLGLTYKSPDPFLLFLGYVLAAALCAVSPLRIRRPSQVTYWLLYFCVFIPGLFVPLFMQLDQSLTLLLLQLSMTAGMLLIALSYRIRLLNLPRYPLNGYLFWGLFVVFFVLFNATLLIVFRSTLHFASVKEVYSQRFGAAKISTENAGISYIASLLSAMMNPFLIAYGLITRRRSLIALGTASQVVVYATAAMKSVLISPLLIIAFYYSLRKDRGGWAPKLGLIITILFFALTTLVIGTNQGILFNMASATLLRTFALPGLFVGQYQYFFENFPHTYLGHVHGINLLFPTQYKLPTGQEISTFYIGGGGENGPMNANACFFAFDGIAGFGLPGIPIMGVICAAMFSVLDSCARKYPLAFSASALTMCTISLTNASLFTAFLGGGVMAFMFLFVVMPRNFLDSDFV